MFMRLAAKCCVLLAVVFVLSLPAAGEFLTVTWEDQGVHFLDDNLNNVGNFEAGAARPLGVATNGSLIWTGHCFTSEIIAYDLAGVEQFRFDTPGYSALQGMELISEQELAFANLDEIVVCDAYTGSVIRTFPNMGRTVEGLAWDGEYLWQLETQTIFATDVDTGEIERWFANPARDEPFGGTAFAVDGDSLFIGAVTGNWYEVDKTDGSAVRTGNNGLDMYGMTYVPEPMSLLLLGAAAVLLHRR
ncbi:MAG: hypothetical protein PVJ57_20925 [Phycisphaerae bacterium]|jgi:hypothetical protein